jgi:hypothetical protein
MRPDPRPSKPKKQGTPNVKTISIETAVEEIIRDIAEADGMHSCDPEAIARVYSVLCVGPGEPVCVVTGDKSASMVYVDGRPEGDNA